MSEVPNIPEGTLLTLRPGEWGGYEGLLSEQEHAVRVVRVYRARSADGFWVVGHGLECSWASVEPHPPCVEIYVRATVLAERAG